MRVVVTTATSDRRRRRTSQSGCVQGCGLATNLAGIADTLNRNATDPCSTAVYWWHDGTFYTLGFDKDGTVSIPPELADVVGALA